MYMCVLCHCELGIRTFCWDWLQVFSNHEKASENRYIAVETVTCRAIYDRWPRWCTVHMYTSVSLCYADPLSAWVWVWVSTRPSVCVVLCTVLLSFKKWCHLKKTNKIMSRWYTFSMFWCFWSSLIKNLLKSDRLYAKFIFQTSIFWVDSNTRNVGIRCPNQLLRHSQE